MSLPKQDRAYQQMGIGPAPLPAPTATAGASAEGDAATATATATAESAGSAWQLTTLAVPANHTLDASAIEGLVPKLSEAAVAELSERFGGKRDPEFELDAVAGAITGAKLHPTSEELVVLTVDAGAEKPRQIVTVAATATPAGGGAPDPGALVGARVIVLVNLKPRKFKGVTSQGMLLAASVADG
jgi:tRNA-binding EMAP/Myf-like protein